MGTDNAVDVFVLGLKPLELVWLRTGALCSAQILPSFFCIFSSFLCVTFAIPGGIQYSSCVVASTSLSMESAERSAIVGALR